MRVVKVDLATESFARNHVFPRFFIPFPDADPAIDLTFIAGDEDKVQAILLARPTMFCHRLDLSPGLPPTARLAYTRSLISFAQGFALNRHFQTHGCLFQVADSNSVMQDFAQTLGGSPSPGTIFRIDHAR